MNVPLFEEEFLDLILIAEDETERREIDRIPNLLIVREMLRNDCALREYITEHYRAQDRIVVWEDIYYIIDQILKTSNATQRKNKTRNYENPKDLLSKVDANVFLKARFLGEIGLIDKNNFVLALLENEDKDMMLFCQKLNISSKNLRDAFRGKVADIFEVVADSYYKGNQSYS